MKGATSDVTAATNMLWVVHTGSSSSASVWGNLGRESMCEQTVFVCSTSPRCVRGKGVRGCVSVPGADKGRVYECVSIHVGLLVSHPADPRTSAEVPCCWADSHTDGWVQPPAHTAAGSAEGPQEISSSQPLLFFKKQQHTVYVRSDAHTHTGLVFFWRLNLGAWPWNSESLLIT